MSDDRTLHMNADYAEKFAALALSHLTREYPNKLDHVLLSDADAKGPRALHPIFYGSFDWHSCVHGYWLLARIYRRFPDVPQAGAIRALFDEHFTTANVAVESAYAAHPARSGFERPYGWAWLLQLSAELSQHKSTEGHAWALSLQPLANVFAKRFRDFLPRATYPIRTGTHFNTAFAVTLAMDYAIAFDDANLQSALRDAALRWFQNDTNAPAWEPSGDDFLSSTLMEAECMQRILSASEFDAWLSTFLPDAANRMPATLFTPASVSDRTDGKIAHLDGLNLSRAWCWRTLAAQLLPDDARRSIFRETADAHLHASLPHVAGDYMGEHWLATYAMLALEA
ncbi:MAG: DUF2891 domain-containing protein [Gemmatimonadaceae bacterium]